MLMIAIVIEQVMFDDLSISYLYNPMAMNYASVKLDNEIKTTLGM